MTAAEANLVKENVDGAKIEKQPTESKPASTEDLEKETVEKPVTEVETEKKVAEEVEVAEEKAVELEDKKAAETEEEKVEEGEPEVGEANGEDTEKIAEESKAQSTEKSEEKVEGGDNKDGKVPPTADAEDEKMEESGSALSIETVEGSSGQTGDKEAKEVEKSGDESEAMAVGETVVNKVDVGKVEDDKKIEEVKEQKDTAVEAAMHLAQGKRNMLVLDFASAVESLQKACELLSAQYGDNASECGEALLYYGRALMELHRKQCPALNEVENADESEDSSEEEGDEEEGGEDESKSEDGEEKEGEEGEASEKKEGPPKDEEDLEKPEPALQDSKLDNIAEESGQDAGDTTKTEEDASSDLQIAFEVLDLAKSIFKRDAEKDPELYLKAADCLLSLGEVGLESDNYTQAIEDFEECLKIQQEMLPKDSRLLAETHYQLGLTYSFVNKYDTSAAFFGDAIQILKLKIESLKKFIEETKAKGGERGSLDDDPVWRSEREIEEIEKLLPEIQSKLDDACEMQKEGAAGPKEKIINQMLNRTPEASPVKSEAKVNVISSNLIKRKRPLEEGEGSSQADKKLKE